MRDWAGIQMWLLRGFFFRRCARKEMKIIRLSIKLAAAKWIEIQRAIMHCKSNVRLRLGFIPGSKNTRVSIIS